MYNNDEPDNYRNRNLESLGLLAGGIAHDFNNILTGITGYIDLAITEVGEDSNVYCYLQEINSICDIARDMVKEIFVSTIKTGEKSPPVHIVPLIKENLKLLRISLPENIKIKEYIEVTSDMVKTNQIQIYHILSNLCINASQAIGDKDGIIEVCLTDIKDDEIYTDLKKEPYLNLSVKDNGCGIKREFLEKIFDPFFTAQKHKKGKGIGLSVVRNIINNMGGKIYVDSKEGEYSIFSIFLPKVSYKEDDIRKTFKKNSELKKSVLCIDDDFDIAITQKKLLERNGYNVTVATDSTEGLNIFLKDIEKYGLIITDYNLGNITGIEVAEKIINVNPGISVILCTGDDSNFIMDKAVKAGIKEVILKPYEYNIFIGKINKWFNGYKV